MKNLQKYIGYGVGALGMDLSYGLFYSFLSFYLTDILYLHPIFLMVVTFAARVWDGINDPIMGAIVDSTKSRFGKYRRWLLIGSICNAVILVLLFSNPGFSVSSGHASIGLYIYVAFMYVFWGMSNTMMDIPYWSMVPSLTSDPKQRNIAATVPRAFSGMGNMIVAVASPLLIPLLGQQENYNAPGYQRWAIICGAALVGLVFISFTSTGKIPAIKNSQPSNTKITGKAVLNTLRSNDQLLIFILVALLMNTGWYMVTGIATHYFTRVVGDPKMQSTFSVLVGVGQAAGLLLIPIFTKWFKRNTVIKLAMGITIAGYLGMYYFSSVKDMFIPFALFGVLGMMGVGCSFVAQTIMLSDIVDYGEYKQGYRSDSVTFSMKGIVQKGAYSIQAVAMFLMLDLTGYDAKLAVQPAGAKAGITSMMFLVPPILTGIALLVFFAKYKLNEAKMLEVNTHKALQEEARTSLTPEP